LRARETGNERVQRGRSEGRGPVTGRSGKDRAVTSREGEKNKREGRPERRQERREERGERREERGERREERGERREERKGGEPSYSSGCSTMVERES
jgi:hypothetical protein